MDELKPLICKRCGGEIDRHDMKCHYCGTYYIYEDVSTKSVIKVDFPGVEVLNVAQAFSRFELANMPKEAIAELTHRSLCGKLAEALYPYMEFEMSDDYLTDNAIIRGRLRVVKPDYRF